jgi:hypothetical protein
MCLDGTDRDSGGATITQYSYSLNGGSYLNFPAGNASSQTISGLSSNTSYTVQLKATSSAGISYPSASYSFTTSALAADAPTITSVTAGDLSISVAFTLGSDNGNPINDVWFSLNGGSYVSSGSTSSPILIGSLTGRIVYSVRIKSQNVAGLSSQSNLLSATTFDTAQDAADAQALIEAQKQAEKDRQIRISTARARVLSDTQAGKEPAKADLLEAEYAAIVEATVLKMLVSIPVFSKAESTTAQDLVIAAQAVEVVEKLSGDLQAKTVSARDLGSIGIEAFAGNFKAQILRGLIATPSENRDSLAEIRAVADSLHAEAKARLDKVAAIVAKIKNRG